MAAQVVEVNESIIEYFGEAMGFQNESKEYRQIATNEFKDQLAKALTVDGKKVVVLWWKDGMRNEDDFKTRLIQEQDQLQEKLDKLAAFISSDKVDCIEPVQKGLLISQRTVMSSYNEILKERLRWL